jgi:uncharacterized repeat protein (TIGR01451 family)
MSGGYSSPFSPAPLPFVEMLATFASDCTTPQSVFNVGDTVCVKASGVPLGFFPRRLTWVAPDSTIVRTTNITTDPQNDSLQINATSVIGTTTVDNRGTWQLSIRNPFFFFQEAQASFTVVDPANATADLGVSSSFNQTEVQAGSQTVFNIQVNNYGPDRSANVVLSDAVPNDSTFVSFQQTSGPVFTCTTPNVGDTGTTTCSISSLPDGSVATFVGTYLVNNGVGGGAEISNTASIIGKTVDNPTGTPDGNDLNNSTTASTTVTPVACVITCPSNIIQDADPGQAGAIVTFPVATGSSSCGNITSDPPSGSFFPVGTSVVTSLSDANGGACTFLVTINNPGNLSISLNGANPLAIECGDDFSDPGATAVDGSNQSVPVVVTLPSGFNPSNPAVGSYTILYTATSGANSVSTQRTVNVSDTTAPSITIQGSSSVTVGCGENFVDPGVSATDACEGPRPVTRTFAKLDSSNHPVSVSGIDTNSPGTYIVTYTASDSGNHTSTASRTVIVTPGGGSSPPTITLNGDPQITAECGSFTDPGAVAVVPCGGSVPVTTTSNVNPHAPGTYTITYTACVEDAPGHCDPARTSSVDRTITIEDTLAPTITVEGGNPLTVECHTTFTDPGATAHDACAGDFPATASGTVDANTVGPYTITYNATDPSGHAATPVTRRVNVVDTTAPTVTAPPNVTVYTGAGSTSCSQTVSDAALGAASANDSCQGSLATTRSGVPSGNIFPTGQTFITYSATDAHNNTGTATQTVTVIDNTPPVITVNGVTKSMWPPNHKYQTFGVTTFVTSVSDNCDSSLGIGSVVIEKVTSDETENGNGDGNTLNDIIIGGDCRTVQLRAERDGGGNGRVYTITFMVTDSSGNVSRATGKVVVPHNPGETPIDSGPHYTVSCGL